MKKNDPGAVDYATYDEYRADNPAYHLLDEERHRAYLDEYIGRAWDEWLRDDVWHDIRRRLPHGRDPDAPFRIRSWWNRELIVRHAYMSAKPEWVAETAVSVVNTRHDECVTAVLSTVYGITPAHQG